LSRRWIDNFLGRKTLDFVVADLAGLPNFRTTTVAPVMYFRIGWVALAHRDCSNFRHFQSRKIVEEPASLFHSLLAVKSYFAVALDYQPRVARVIGIASC